MNQEIHSADRPDSDQKPAAASSFSKLFGVGIVGWFLGVLAILIFSLVQQRDSGGAGAVIWTLSHGWIAFCFGLLVMVAYSAATRRSVAGAVLGYVLPAAALCLVAGICLAVYPDAILREEFLTYLPLVFLFYVFGYFWMKMGERSASGSSYSRAILPAAVGGLVVLGSVAAPVFASDAFIYRDAFLINISKTGMRDGVIRFEGSLEIRKPGNYHFSAPRYVWDETAGPGGTEPEVELGEFIWGTAGAPKADSTGVYPLQIVWRKGGVQASAVDAVPYENWFNIEVRKADEGNRVISSISAPLSSR